MATTTAAQGRGPSAMAEVDVPEGNGSGIVWDTDGHVSVGCRRLGGWGLGGGGGAGGWGGAAPELQPGAAYTPRAQISTVHQCRPCS